MGLTYWVDNSCKRFPAVYEALGEAIFMAQLVTRRAEHLDDDFRTMFRTIFNTDVSNTVAFDTVQWIMDGIARMTLVSGTGDSARKLSDVRLYCDQGKRWNLQPDREIPDGIVITPFRKEFFDSKQEPTPNSQRPASDQVYVDSINKMVAPGDGLRCPPRMNADLSSMIIPSYQDENPHRSVMTLCRPWIQANYPSIRAVKLANLDSCILNLTHYAWDYLLSVTLLHELTHMPSFDTNDLAPAYGWNDAVAKPWQKAIGNAENYAYFGLLAVLDLAGCKLVSRIAGEGNQGLLERIEYFHTPKGGTEPRKNLALYGLEGYL